MKSTSGEEREVWICLLVALLATVRFDVVPNVTSEAFLGYSSFKALFRGVRQCKNFKSASKELKKITHDPSVVKYFAQENIKWSYNLENAQWWGGFYEGLVKSLKRCLKKTIGRAKLSYDELVTVAAEAEMVLNSRTILCLF